MCGERFVAEFVSHQAVPEISDAEGEAGSGRWTGEAEARQARHDDVERVGLVGIVRDRVGQHSNHALETDERVGEAVREDEREWVRSAASLVNEMNTHAVDVGTEVRESIQRGFPPSPIEAQPPMLDEPMKKRRAGTGAPLVGVRVRGPSCSRKTRLKIVECRLRDMDQIRFDAHRAPRFEHPAVQVACRVPTNATVLY
jgi:hypothetical protein